jgi:hypothetical protein
MCLTGLTTKGNSHVKSTVRRKQIRTLSALLLGSVLLSGCSFDNEYGRLILIVGVLVWGLFGLGIVAYRRKEGDGLQSECYNVPLKFFTPLHHC